MAICTHAGCGCVIYLEELLGAPDMRLNGNCVNCEHRVNAHPRRPAGGGNAGHAGHAGNAGSVIPLIHAPLASGHQVLPQPPLPPAPEGYIRMTEILRGVDGSLTVLSPHHGFRKFVQAKAMEIGITGSIQRYHHSDVRMRYEGTASQ
eukprot:gene11972-13564_t